jgi:hypothetical protein
MKKPLNEFSFPSHFNSKEKSQKSFCPLSFPSFFYLGHQKAPHIIILECLVTWKGGMEWRDEEKFPSNATNFHHILFLFSNNTIHNFHIRVPACQTCSVENEQGEGEVWMCLLVCCTQLCLENLSDNKWLSRGSVAGKNENILIFYSMSRFVLVYKWFPCDFSLREMWRAAKAICASSRPPNLHHKEIVTFIFY